MASDFDVLGESDSGFSVHRCALVVVMAEVTDERDPGWFRERISSTNIPYRINSDMCTLELNASSQSCPVMARIRSWRTRTVAGARATGPT